MQRGNSNIAEGFLDSAEFSEIVCAGFIQLQRIHYCNRVTKCGDVGLTISDRPQLPALHGCLRNGPLGSGVQILPGIGPVVFLVQCDHSICTGAGIYQVKASICLDTRKRDNDLSGKVFTITSNFYQISIDPTLPNLHVDTVSTDDQSTVGHNASAALIRGIAGNYNTVSLSQLTRPSNCLAGGNSFDTDTPLKTAFIRNSSLCLSQE